MKALQYEIEHVRAKNKEDGVIFFQERKKLDKKIITLKRKLQEKKEYL